MNNNIQVLERLKALYQTLNAANCRYDLLAEVYHSDLEFSDSFHQIQGLTQFTDYLHQMYANVQQCQFEYTDELIHEEKACLRWVMLFSHPRLKGGAELKVSGCSWLTFADEKIIAHQDYFDGGELLYEHVPVLGSAIRLLKKRMAA